MFCNNCQYFRYDMMYSTTKVEYYKNYCIYGKKQKNLSSTERVKTPEWCPINSSFNKTKRPGGRRVPSKNCR
jgi:hypothetical protein